MGLNYFYQEAKDEKDRKDEKLIHADTFLFSSSLLSFLKTSCPLIQLFYPLYIQLIYFQPCINVIDDPWSSWVLVVIDPW